METGLKILILNETIINRIILKDRHLIDHSSYQREIPFGFFFSHTLVKSSIKLLINIALFLYSSLVTCIGK